MVDRFPAARVGDERITVRDEVKAMRVRTGRDTTEYRHENLGYTGHCTLSVRAEAAMAGAIVAHGGTHADVLRVDPRFQLSPALERRLRDELECAAVRDALLRADDLAAAAGHLVTGVVSIGEVQPRERADHREDFVAYSMSAAPPSGDDVEHDLDELRPAPEMRRARMPLRVSIEPERAQPEG